MGRATAALPTPAPATTIPQGGPATVASVSFQSKKEDSETKVGNAMYLEGGVGADFLKGGLSVGLVYYNSMKLTSDRIENQRRASTHTASGSKPALRARRWKLATVYL